MPNPLRPDEALVALSVAAGAESFPPVGQRARWKTATRDAVDKLQALREAIDRLGGVWHSTGSDYPVLVARVSVDKLADLHAESCRLHCGSYALLVEPATPSLGWVDAALAHLPHVVCTRRAADGAVEVIVSVAAYLDAAHTEAIHARVGDHTAPELLRVVVATTPA